MSRFISADAAAMPYSDRKLMRLEEGGMPLSIGTVILIQRLDCMGLSRDEILAIFSDQTGERIYRALPELSREQIDAQCSDRYVTMEQISRVLDPKDESVDASRKRYPERANVGYSKIKQRFR